MDAWVWMRVCVHVGMGVCVSACGVSGHMGHMGLNTELPIGLGCRLCIYGIGMEKEEAGKQGVRETRKRVGQERGE